MAQEVKTQKPIAVSSKEAAEFGCPYCGHRSGYPMIGGPGTTVMRCAECGRGYTILAEGVTKSTIGIGSYEDKSVVYPKLQPHPRRGIPAHGAPDERPEDGGEFFHSRGLGLDWVPCFMCPGTKRELRKNIAAFVQCKAAGERIVDMFETISSGGAWLDYRRYEPDRIQVKTGACEEHEQNLEELHRLVTASDGVITEEIIRQAMQA